MENTTRFAPDRALDVVCLGRFGVDFYAQQIGARLEDVTSFSKYLGGSSANTFNVSGWNGFGWVRNLFDAEYYEVLASQSGSTGLVVGQPGDPRTYGVTISKSF